MPFNKVRIRDDDVLVHSSQWEDPFKRFRGFHNVVCQDTEHFIHVAAILCTEISAFPEAIDFIKAEVTAGRMEAQIHGWKHIDYGQLIRGDVKHHLGRCFEFFLENDLPTPTIFYTPWGASQRHLHDVAEEMGLRLVDTSGIIHPGQASDKLKIDSDTLFFEGKEILRHWWEGCGSLNEFIQLYQKLCS